MKAITRTRYRGGLLLLCGLMLQMDWSLDLLKVVMILVFILATNPTASHSMAKAALHGGQRPLVTTSTVLILGMGGTLFAENKGVTDFGKIAMSVYVLALLADLVVLPATLARFGPGAYLRGKKERS